MKKRKLTIVTLEICDFILMLVPLGIVVLINRNKYFYSYEGIKLSFGMVVALILAILFIKKKVKFNYAVWLGIFTLLVYLMQVLLADGVLLLGMASIGAFIDCFIFQPIIKYQKKLYDKEVEANINAKAMGSVLSEAINKPKQQEQVEVEEEESGEINGRG